MIRVNKTIARKEYNNNNTIIILPINVSYENKWILPAYFNKKEINESFENVVNRYEFYNCNNVQVGRYAKFYIKRK